MKQVIEELRQLAQDLPEELRKIRDQTLRMADLLGVGLTPKELKGISKVQKFYERIIVDKDNDLKQVSAEKRPKLEAEYYAEIAVALALLDRLFGPATTVQSYGRS